MRKQPTNAEWLLWQQLRRRQVSGNKFRRQPVIGRFIVDFACLERQLIVEVDGGYHQEGDQPELDRDRDAELAGLGFRVLRFSNEAVETRITAVLDEIRAALL
ncbi:endonuclease domain-containing protein [Flaviaesturariibacter flavus]|nr:endonuclease domain-containing protein [Flaviaesturariibacter flavus]